MEVIWKFELKDADIQKVAMPDGAEILSVANQNGNLCLWAKMPLPVMASDDLVLRVIQIVGTGNPIRQSVNRKFIGTVLMNQFVWHVFELV